MFDCSSIRESVHTKVFLFSPVLSISKSEHENVIDSLFEFNTLNIEGVSRLFKRLSDQVQKHFNQLFNLVECYYFNRVHNISLGLNHHLKILVELVI